MFWSKNKILDGPCHKKLSHKFINMKKKRKYEGSFKPSKGLFEPAKRKMYKSSWIFYPAKAIFGPSGCGGGGEGAGGLLSDFPQ